MSTRSANLVAEVTDDKKLSKAERQKLQVEHAPAKSERVKIIKLADKTSNLRSLVTRPHNRLEACNGDENISIGP
jgi:(p)ppGpp synthase/HD superfamily hydrolase